MTTATADLADAHSDELQICKLPMQQFGGTRCFAGPVRTVKLDERPTVLREVLNGEGAGAVLVADAGGRLDAALLGEDVASKAMVNGWRGIIINGVLRDTARLSTMQLGIKALGTCPQRAPLTGSLLLDVPVIFGGVRFASGHWVYCDDDGIVVASRQLD